MWAILSLLLTAGPSTAAVFEIENREAVLLSEGKLRDLTEYLSAKLAENLGLSIVPRSEVQAQLLESKKDSYRLCYDDACQIEIGKAVAAQKVVRTTLLRLGDKCILKSELIDLRTELTERVASERGSCTEAGVVALIEELTPRLAERPGNGSSARHPLAEALTPSEQRKLIESATTAFLKAECGNAADSQNSVQQVMGELVCLLPIGRTMDRVNVDKAYLGRFHLDLGGEQVVLVVSDSRVKNDSKDRLVVMQKASGSGDSWSRVGELPAGWGPAVEATLTERSGRQRLVACLMKGKDGCFAGGCGVVSVEGAASRPEVIFTDVGLPFGFVVSGERDSVSVESVGIQDLNGDGVQDLEFVVDVTPRGQVGGSGTLHRVRVLAEGNGFRRQGALPYRAPWCLGL